MQFAVVDVETTGGSPHVDRIMEIGIVLVDDGIITETYETLVDPDRDIPPFVQNLTGITPKMVKHAPPFHQVASKIDQMLADRIFVAHNVAFDYGFIKAELNRAGFFFETSRLCTVKLSRKVFPGMPSYSLHKLSNALEIPDFKHHRALGDALAAAELLMLADKRGAIDEIQKEIRGGVKPAFLPKGWDEKKIQTIPRTAGILWFHGKNDKILYICAARNMREKVLSLLSNVNRGPLSAVREGLCDISFEGTGSDLLAKLCVASALFKNKYPCNVAVRSLSDVGAPLPDMVVFGPGRSEGEKVVIVVRNNQVLGFQFVDEEGSFSLSCVMESLRRFPESLNLVPHLRPVLQGNRFRVVFQ